MSSADNANWKASFESYLKGALGGGNSGRVFAGFPDSFGGAGGGGDGTNVPSKKDKKKPVVDPPVTPQWTFQPNAYDQSPYGAPGAGGGPAGPGPGPASQYTMNLPRQPWMLNPAGQPAQGPQTPQEEQSLRYYQQWAPPYPTGY